MAKDDNPTNQNGQTENDIKKDENLNKKKSSGFKIEEKPKGPIGWEAIKGEIKKDYEQTEEKLKKQKPEKEQKVQKKQTLKKEQESQKKQEPEKEQEVPDKSETLKKELTPEKQPLKPEEKAAVPETKPEIQQKNVKAKSEEVFNKYDQEEEEEERKEVFRIISKYVLGGCIVLIIISAIFFFRIPQNIFGYVKNIFTGDESQIITEDQNVEIPEKSDIEMAAIEISLIIGANRGTTFRRFQEGFQDIDLKKENINKIKETSPSIYTSLIVGMPIAEYETESLASYMDVLMRLQNAFKTNIHQLLDNVTNRSDALNIHLNKLETLQKEAEETFNKINTKKDELKIQFEEITELKGRIEKDFFRSMENLEALNANELLNEFIEVSQKQIELRAEYNALNKASTLFNTALNNMEARIKDIKFNREALIKGVKVVDIKGSDLELIISESEL